MFQIVLASFVLFAVVKSQNSSYGIDPAAVSDQTPTVVIDSTNVGEVFMCLMQELV
jgi:hypothetical protein